MFKIKSQKAFTLIELLVVMAIIAILSAIMFGPIQTARRRSKDTQAVADMKLLQNYLTLWGDDHNGKYPNSLSELSIYGAIPISRINTSTTVPNYYKYNYTPIGSSMCASTTSCYSYHLYTKLNDNNPAFNSDADCDSGNIGDNCWTSNDVIGYDPLNLSIDTDALYCSSGINVDCCKSRTLNCILDYTNIK